MEDSTKKENSLSEQKIFISLSPEETEALGAVLGESLQQGDVVALNAPLGAGKTVFIRGVVRAFGIEDPVKSPSYTIINEYEAHRRDACFPLYHIDAYRLSGVDDFESAGGTETLDGFSIALIEWAERISNILPKETINISIKIREDGKREISYSTSHFKKNR